MSKLQLKSETAAAWFGSEAAVESEATCSPTFD